jgi:hypothetical protein
MITLRQSLPAPLLLALVMLASPAHADTPRNELTLGATFSNYWSSMRVTYGHELGELSYHRPLGDQGLPGALVVGGGLRYGPVPFQEAASVKFPLEVYAQFQLRARYGIWEAQAGPEVGWSGLARLPLRPGLIPESGNSPQEEARLLPVYVAAAVSPLQLRFGWFLVSALEFHIGLTAWPVNSAVRYQVGLLRLGVSL